MKPIHATYLIAVAVLAAGLAGVRGEETIQVLRARVDAIIGQPLFSHAEWGIKAVSLDSGATLVEVNAGKLMTPASNVKLYTAALALDRLGPDFKITTSFYAASKPDTNGILTGDLIVYGRGDPSFSARFHDGEADKSLATLADALVRAGVKRIDRDLVADAGYFHGPPYGSGWQWDDLAYGYAAPASALSVDDNALPLLLSPGHQAGGPCQILEWLQSGLVTVTNRTTTIAAGSQPSIRLERAPGGTVVSVVGSLPLDSKGDHESVAVPSPALWFVTRLKEEMARRGVTVAGRARLAEAERNLGRMEIARVESPPLSALVSPMMKESVNLYAQLLLLQVGARSPTNGSPTAPTTEAAGLEEMKRFLHQAGLAPDDVRLKEGSGLSREDEVTPNATVQLLAFMAKHRAAAIFREALPIAGVDGTLAHRFAGTVAQNNLRAKTGSLRLEHALAGYLTTKSGERVAFSIMLNNSTNPTAANEAAVDSLAGLLADLGVRPSSRRQ